MDADQSLYQTQLFTVRVWHERLGDGQEEWRGQIKHIPSGDVRYFRDWPTLIQLLLAQLEDDVSETMRRQQDGG